VIFKGTVSAVESGEKYTDKKQRATIHFTGGIGLQNYKDSLFIVNDIGLVLDDKVTIEVRKDDEDGKQK
jgi:hypothetical protein